ncbi:50S ribosomal protein L10, chloroplastic [Chenopodium quinoa]|uniref:Large ribosomal subunit protein uL10c n=1 Tax=Chenopodium quinoa TaxID=63459 RepID=A0A803MEK1_CHEQI|nr:50S ribosomal protein L10, chloroplastic [Chenopodium quinoa]
MESTLFLSKPLPSTIKPTHSLSSLSPNPFFSFKPHNLSTHKHPTTTIKAAISRTKKEETVETVQKHLENCYLLAAINYKGFTVKQFQDLRKSLPENTTLLVAKNTLVEKAVQDTQWEAIKPCMKGMNAWLFVHSEEIPVAIKPYRTFQKERKLEDNDFTGACFEGKFYGPDEVKRLETMPSKAEVFAKLLGSLKSPGNALVGTIQAPARDLVLVLKAYIKKLEDEQQQ